MDALLVLGLFLVAVALNAWLLWFASRPHVVKVAREVPVYVHVLSCQHECMMYCQEANGYLHWWCAACDWQRWSREPFVPAVPPAAVVASGCSACLENGCCGWCRCAACHEGVCE